MHSKFLPEFTPALIAAGFLGTAAVLQSFAIHPLTMVAGFLAAFSVYLADHSLPAQNRWTWPLILICSSGFTVTAFYAGQFSLPGCVGYILLALFYVLPLLPRKKRLQDFPRLRVCAVIGGWAAIPLLLKPFQFQGSGYLHLAGMAALLLPALILSDLADETVDRRSGRITWSCTLSKTKIRNILTLSTLSSLVCFTFNQSLWLTPAPALYLFGRGFFLKHPATGDLVLLYPLVISLLAKQFFC